MRDMTNSTDLSEGQIEELLISYISSCTSEEETSNDMTLSINESFISFEDDDSIFNFFDIEDSIFLNHKKDANSFFDNLEISSISDDPDFIEELSTLFSFLTLED